MSNVSPCPAGVCISCTTTAYTPRKLLVTFLPLSSEPVLQTWVPPFASGKQRQKNPTLERCRCQTNAADQPTHDHATAEKLEHLCTTDSERHPCKTAGSYDAATGHPTRLLQTRASFVGSGMRDAWGKAAISDDTTNDTGPYRPQRTHATQPAALLTGLTSTTTTTTISPTHQHWKPTIATNAAATPQCHATGLPDMLSSRAIGAFAVRPQH